MALTDAGLLGVMVLLDFLVAIPSAAFQRKKLDKDRSLGSPCALAVRPPVCCLVLALLAPGPSSRIQSSLRNAFILVYVAAVNVST